MEEIKIGDVVWLKSGSPAMTVTKILSDNLCECTMYVDGKIEYPRVNILALTKKEPNKSSSTFRSSTIH